MKLSSILLSTLFWEGQTKKPNVVLLIADDLGMGDLSLNNKNGKIHTPNIDKIGLEGINFLDAHSASTKCSPSRYMLMTGRFAFQSNGGKGEAVRKLFPGIPHLATLFKRNGYRTGIVGKTAPIVDAFVSDADKAEHKKMMIAEREYKKALGSRLGKGSASKEKKSFYLPGNYTMPQGAHTIGYDYSFLSANPCCRVGGGYFENGIGTKPFNRYGIQRPYPEGSIGKNTKGVPCLEYTTHTGEARCGWKAFSNGYIAPPHNLEKIDGRIYVGNLPASILVQEDFDSRSMERHNTEKAIQYIKESANKDKPFFLYYGTRSGHNPFNSEPQWRGKGKLGEIGENIMELDHNIGKIMKTLKDHNIDDDTLVVFMSDNGAIAQYNHLNRHTSWVVDTFGHYQNSMDLNGKHYELRSGKNSPYEGGHRMPFLWRYPKMIKKPRIEKDSIVTYVDVYRTLAEIIGDTDLACNEAPDSRSLVDVLKGEKILRTPILQHAVFSGGRAMRDGKWKIVPGTKELFNLDEDIQELNNLYKTHPLKAKEMMDKADKMVQNVIDRETRTQEGRKPNVC